MDEIEQMTAAPGERRRPLTWEELEDWPELPELDGWVLVGIQRSVGRLVLTYEEEG